MSEAPHISFTRADKARFERALAEAQSQGRDRFTFDGHEFLVDYARYVVRYLDLMMGDDNDAST